MQKKYETLVFIGRMQPPTLAHAEIIRRAQDLAKQLIIIIGSADQPRTYKNPWSAAERAAMIQSIIHGPTSGPDACMVRIEKNFDSIYNDDAWSARIQAIVGKHTATHTNIGIIGYQKDESSYYLKMFPQWTLEETDLIEPLNATDVRDLYFKRNGNIKYLHGVVPQSVYDQLVGWKHSKDYEQILKEREFLDEYKSQFVNLKYSPTFVTADALVVQAGHVLMVKRRSEPGRGLFALPGGFLNANTDKSMTDCAIRELLEETDIDVPEKVLRGSVVGSKVFDAINRSARGRTITHVLHISLPDGEWKLPKVRGLDDAEVAQWIPFGSLKRDQIFEDHSEVIENMTGIIIN